MAGVDVDTGVLKTVMGKSKGTGRKGLSLKLRLSSNGSEQAKGKEPKAPPPPPPPPPSLSKYKDHSLLRVVDMTLKGQGMPKSEMVTPWILVDLKKRKRPAEKDASGGGGSSKKKHKSGSKGKKSKVSFTVKFKTGKDPSPSSKTESLPVKPEEKCKKEDSCGASGLQSTRHPATGTSPVDPPILPRAEMVDSGVGSSDWRVLNQEVQTDLKQRCCEQVTRGVQCDGGANPKTPTSSAAGPSSSAPFTQPSLEASLSRMHECLVASAQATNRAPGHYRKLWNEGKSIKRMAEKKRDEGSGFSMEIVSLFLHSALKFMESAGLQEASSNVMLETGKLFFSVASYSRKMVAHDFVKQCMRVLSERLGASAYLRYSHQVGKDEQNGPTVIHDALRIIGSTTQALTGLRKQASSIGSRATSAVALIEAVLMNSGMGPLEQHLYLAKKAMDELEKVRI
ncbi:hypothetical protein BSKO_11539 [Bryopsis sp. KO-2023]|nr:hypothetical protein BSKO_11539 [Bryopsis sp. KO-2023]